MPTTHLLPTLLPLDSVKLGRLVYNPHSPHEEYIDPLDGRPHGNECQKVTQVNFKDTQKFSSTSALRTQLSEILSFSFERIDATTATLSAPLATKHDLMNCETWFTTACDEKTTQDFLQKALFNRQKVYMVVGFRTVENADVAKDASRETDRGTRLQTPAYLGIAAASVARAIVPPNAGCTSEAGNYQKLSYNAPGEQVFAVLYRKVKFKWLSKRVIGNIALKGKHRWVSIWDWRGVADNGDEGGDDVIEANLTDSGDVDDLDEEYDSGEESDSLLQESPGCVGGGESDGDVNEVMSENKPESPQSASRALRNTVRLLNGGGMVVKISTDRVRKRSRAKGKQVLTIRRPKNHGTAATSSTFQDQRDMFQRRVGLQQASGAPVLKRKQSRGDGDTADTAGDGHRDRSSWLDHKKKTLDTISFYLLFSCLVYGLLWISV